VPELWTLDHIEHFMKTRILLPVVLLTIIAILGGTLAHEILLRHRAARGQMQFEVAVFVQLHQNLDRGEVDAAKRRLGALVTVQSDAYEKYFGQETDSKFAPMLAQAKAIKLEFETSK
jgi:hypothetical protein